MNEIFLATVGARIRVTPWDDLCVSSEHEMNFVSDRSPFEFQMAGRLEEGQIFYGLYGPVVSGPERYRGLICNALIRADGSDWRNSTVCQANFKVGPSIATRCREYDVRHPEGTAVSGYPVISRFGEIAVVEISSPG